jgi:hypothetical protein
MFGGGVGELRLDKLAHLAASFMAAGMGWAGFSPITCCHVRLAQ